MALGDSGNATMFRLYRRSRPPEGGALTVSCTARDEADARRIASENIWHPAVEETTAAEKRMRSKVEPDPEVWLDPGRTGCVSDGRSSYDGTGIYFRDFDTPWPEETTPRALYARDALRVDQEPWRLDDFVPELGYRMPREPVEQLQIRTLADPYIDGTRCWWLATVWWEGKPVMIVQEAGRSGKDHRRRFITDPEQYLHLVQGLLRLVGVDSSEEEFVPLDLARTDLINFYSGNVFEAQAASEERERSRRAP